MKTPESQARGEALMHQLRARFPDAIGEFLWAAAEANRNFQKPPLWVAFAIAKASGQALDQVRLLPEILLGSIPLEVAGKIDGQMEVETATLKTPSPEQVELEQRFPGLTPVREALSKVSDKYRETLTTSPILKERELTAEETAEFLKGQGLGAAQAAKEMKTEDSMTTQICLLLWLYWKEVDAMKDRTTIYGWLNEKWGLHFSFKLLEKICDDIGLRPAKRGRPRNPTVG